MPAGRPKGALNKATRDIKALAQPYAPEALKTLAQIMRKSESDQARVAASKELIDRAFGKAPQALTGDPDHPVRVLAEIRRTIVDPTER